MRESDRLGGYTASGPMGEGAGLADGGRNALRQETCLHGVLSAPPPSRKDSTASGRLVTHEYLM